MGTKPSMTEKISTGKSGGMKGAMKSSTRVKSQWVKIWPIMLLAKSTKVLQTSLSLWLLMSCGSIVMAGAITWVRMSLEQKNWSANCSPMMSFKSSEPPTNCISWPKASVNMSPIWFMLLLSMQRN
jgi:hypothetical protein